MQIHERLKATREDKDIMQKEIAKHIGVTERQIYRWENDLAEMGIYKLKAICLYYGVSADYILGLPDNLEKPNREKRTSEVKCQSKPQG